MAVSVSLTEQFIEETVAGPYIKNAKLNVSGLTASGNNTVPHGLTDGKGNAVTPITVSIEPTSNNNFYEYQAADATNIYVGVGSGAGTSCNIYVEY
jgi:hypothetical protein